MSIDEASAVRGTTASDADPRKVLLVALMSRCQTVAVAMTMALCALDGFDILAITFAAPGIVSEWGINHAQLGAVFGAGLIGFGAGSLLVAPLADLFGRRLMVLWSLVLMAVGMYLTACAASVAMLSLCRFTTGLGIGSMAATINSLAAEFANARRRDLALGLLNVGFPLGGVAGGFIAAWLLRHYDWRSIFILGGTLSLIMLPMVLWFVPEPIGFLIEQRGPKALERVNALLMRCGHPSVAELPQAANTSTDGVGHILDIFGRGQVRTTLHIAAIFFLNVMTVYYLMSWMPQMVTDLGFTASAATSVSAIANLTGIPGGVLLGWMADRSSLKKLTQWAMLGLGISTALFGFVAADITLLRLSSGAAGFFIFASMIGLYSVISRTFPTHARATGTGFIIGFSRVGSALAPFIAGLLFSNGLGRGGVSVLMGIAAVLGAVLLTSFTVRPAAN